MLTRIRPRLVIDLARRELPTPVDVINLIDPDDFERYRWYALAVMPAMKAAGGRVLWMGRLDRQLAGERQAEKLIVVRYPSHRHFLAMTLNPYYLAINRLREAGVSRFEASFTHASHTDPGLVRRPALAGAHFTSAAGSDGLGEITRLFSDGGYQLAYATRVSAELAVLEPQRPTDPNPLGFRELALFAPGPEAIGDPGELASALAELVGEPSLQLYAREPRSEYRPVLRPAAQVAS